MTVQTCPECGDVVGDPDSRPWILIEYATDDALVGMWHVDHVLSKIQSGSPLHQRLHLAASAVREWRSGRMDATTALKVIDPLVTPIPGDD